MSIVDRIGVVCADVTDVEADLLVMKYANDFYGADAAVAARLGYTDGPAQGGVDIVPGTGIAADEVMFIAVGPLYDFRYSEIKAFGARILELLTERRPRARTVCTTIHGVGYGLDEREAFLSLIDGLIQAPRTDDGLPKRIIFAEQDAARADRLSALLRKKSDGLKLMERRESQPGLPPEAPRHAESPSPRAPARPQTRGRPPEPGTSQSVQKFVQRNKHPRVVVDYDVEEYGTASETKPRLFVAMPFSEDHRDEYDIAFVEAAHSNNYICERLDLEHYVGDVVREIERRIRAARGMIALLNDLNPNVFLEIGYAMAIGKPIIFVAKDDVTVPFDVRNYRRVEYKRIFELREAMNKEISALANGGVI